VPPPPPHPAQYANAGTLKKLLLTQTINPTKKLFSLEVGAGPAA